MPRWSVVPLRAFLGVAFLYAGIDKLVDPAFIDRDAVRGLASQLLVSHGPASGLFRHLEPHATALGALVAGAEIVVGLATLLGVVARSAAAIGAICSLGFWLTVGWGADPWYYGNDLPYLAGWVTLALAGSGPWTVHDLRHRRPPAGVDVGRRAALAQAVGVLGAATGIGVLARAFGRPSPLRRVPATAAETAPARMGQPVTTTPSVTTGGPTTTAVSVSPAATASTSAPALVAKAAPLPMALPSSATAPAGEGASTTSPAPAPVTTAPATTASTSPSPTSPSPTTEPGTAGLVVAASADVKSGNATLFRNPRSGQDSYVTRTADGTAVAFSRRCTHQSCDVREDRGTGLMVCACHSSAFTMAEGQPMAGPALYPLERVAVTEGDGQIRLA